MLWTERHRAFVIETYFRNNNSVGVTQRLFRGRFTLDKNANVPSRNSILLWVQNFKETGSVLKKKPTGRNRDVRTPEMIKLVRKAVKKSPHLSTAKHANILGISDRTIRRILHEDLFQNLELTKNKFDNSDDDTIPNLSDSDDEFANKKLTKEIKTYFNSKKRSAGDELEIEVPIRRQKTENSPSTSGSLLAEVKTEKQDPLNIDSLSVKIKGNRITSVHYYFEKLRQISLHNPAKGCLFSHLKILSEEADGLISQLHVRCENCMEDFNISLTDLSEPKNTNLNQGLVNKDIHDSLGYGGLKMIFDSMDVPIMNEKKYKEILKEQILSNNQIFIKEEPFDIKCDLEEKY